MRNLHVARLFLSGGHPIERESQRKPRPPERPIKERKQVPRRLKDDGKL